MLGFQVDYDPFEVVSDHPPRYQVIGIRARTASNKGSVLLVEATERSHFMSIIFFYQGVKLTYIR